MNVFSSKVILVVLFFGIHWVYIESQDFCHSYKHNNYSMIIFTQNQSDDTILLIIDKYFWRIRRNNSEFVFDKNDFQASNSTEQWSESNYTFANSIFDKNNKSYRGIALFKDMNEIYKFKYKNITLDMHTFRKDYFNLHQNYFENTQMNGISDFLIVHERRFTFTLFDEMKDCEVIQTFNATLKKFQRIVEQRIHYWNASLAPGPFVPGPFGVISGNILPCHSTINRIKNGIKRLQNFKNEIPIIGIHLNSTNGLICFFRIKGVIKYCICQKCIRDGYKVLISCAEKVSKKFVPNFWIFIGITVVVIPVFAVIAGIIIYCMRDRKTHSTTIWKSVKYSTIKTLDSETGLPKNNSKDEMSLKLESISSSSVSETSVSLPKSQNQKDLENQKIVAKKVEKVSPLKSQKPTTPAKVKDKIKPKKGPELKI